MKKKFFLFILLILSFSCFAQYSKEVRFPFIKWWEPQALSVFREAFPDVNFTASFDKNENDWLIHVQVKNPEGSKKKFTTTDLYWCEGRFLPKERLSERYSYRIMLYEYKDRVPDPSTFTAEEIERIKVFTARDNRRNSPVDPPFLYDAIFKVNSRANVESQIVQVPFLTKSVNVHQGIAEKIKKISKKIMELPRDEELNRFFKTLDRTDCYAWRSVRDTQSRSFHSIGFAIDILPKGYYQKIIYWSWQKQLDPENWYMTPLSKRWSPPQKIIDIFEDEGFIWGGKWIVWDNMHFEYRPELLVFKSKNLKNVR